MTDRKRNLVGLVIIFAFLVMLIALALAFTDTPARVAESVADYQQARAMTELAKANGRAIKAMSTQLTLNQVGRGFLTLTLVGVLIAVILGLGVNVIIPIAQRYRTAFGKPSPRKHIGGQERHALEDQAIPAQLVPRKEQEYVTRNR